MIDFLVSCGVALLSGLGVGSGGLLVVFLTKYREIGQLFAQGVNLIFFIFSSGASTAVYVSIDGNFGGIILISDAVKENSRRAVENMRALGVTRCVMLTGDSDEIAESVASELGLDEYRASLLPADKLEAVEGMLSEREKVAFVGDGINDAPVLARADVGIAMGAMGSDAAIEAADVVLMKDDPLDIAKAIKISRKTLSIVKQNIIFSLAVKFGCLALVALGFADMWLGIFADVGVMVIAVLNAIRAMRIG